MFRTAITVTLLLALIGLVAPAADAHPDHDTTITRLTREIAADPDDARLHLQRARAYRLVRHYADALADCDAAARLDPQSADVHFVRAAVQLDAGRSDLALTSVDHGLIARPTFGPGHALRGDVLFAMGRDTDAAAAYGKAIELSRDPRPERFLQQAAAYAAAGDDHLDDAIAAINKGIVILGPLVSLTRPLERLEARRAAVPAKPVAKPAAPIVKTTPRVIGTPEPEAKTPEVVEPAPAKPPRRITRGPYLQRATPTSMTIRWRTNRTSPSVVHLQRADGRGRSVRHLRDYRTEHAMVLTDLEPATRYRYAVQVDPAQPPQWSEHRTFTTSPTPGVDRPTRVWVIGDSGTANDNARAVRDAGLAATAERRPDLWLMLGDNAYNDGTDTEYQRAVFEMYPNLLATIPMWPTLGNHDGRSADSLTESGAYYNIFTLPTKGEAGGLPSGTEAYYSFDYGSIHFVCLDSHDSDRRPGSAMLTWLEADLAAAATAAGTRWVIAFWHHPPYSKGSHDSDNPADSGGRLIDMRTNVLPVLDAGGVDLVLCGHSHNYERSFLVDGHYGFSPTLRPTHILDGGDGRPSGGGAYRKASATPAAHEGTVYIVAGNGGSVSKGPVNHPVMVVGLNELGSVILDIDGPALIVRFIDEKGEERDTFEVHKGVATK